MNGENVHISWLKCESCNLYSIVHMINTWHYSNREIQIPWCSSARWIDRLGASTVMFFVRQKEAQALQW